MNLKAPIRNEDAERDCTRAIELDGRNVKGWFRRGQARVGLNRLEDAQKGARDGQQYSYTLTRASVDFERVLQLEPKNDAAQQEIRKVAQAVQDRNARLHSKKVHISYVVSIC